MAQLTNRANLSAKTFPFLSSNWGRSIILPQNDQNFSRQLVSGEDQDKDIGIPQIYYCHNVMPTAHGFQSVGFTPVVMGGLQNFNDIFILHNNSGINAQMGVCTDGNIYVNEGTGWVLQGNYPNAMTGLVSTAHVNGVTYVYIQGYGCLLYNFSTHAFVAVTLNGLNTTQVTGICGAANYMIAWLTSIPATVLTLTTSTASPVISGIANTSPLYVGQSVSGPNITPGTVIAAIVINTSVTLSQNPSASGSASVTFVAGSSFVSWSSTIDPTDFTPSLITGAGGGAIQGARGIVNLCVPHTMGFIVYTSANAVAALFTGNARYPFNFREILTTGGLASLQDVAYDMDSGNHWAYTTSGLQLISPTSSTTEFPELTDFISGRLFEDFNDTTQVFSQTQLTQPMQKRVQVVSDRYLVISYGVSSLTHALVFDLVQKRWGKLKIPHVAVLEFEIPAIQITEIPKQSFGFLQVDGTVQIVNFTVWDASSNGTIVLGKYQYVRSRLMTLDAFVVEDIRIGGAAFKATILTALDGKNNVASTPFLDPNSFGLSQQYFSRAIGLNHSLLFQGAFDLNSLTMTFHIDGKR